MIAATGTKTSRLNGTTSRNVPLPSVRSSAGTPAPVWTFWSCHTLASPRTTRLMPRVMISGWTRKTPTPMPVIRPTRAATTSGTMIAAGRPQLLMSVAVTNPAIDATAPTDRSIPPVSIASDLAAGQDRQRHRLAQDDGGPRGPDDPGVGQLDHHDQHEEQAGQRDDRPVAEQAAPRLRALPPRRADCGAHTRILQTSTTRADISTPMRITPCTTKARLGSMFMKRHVGPDQLQDEDGDDRTDDAAATAGQADTAEHDGRHALAACTARAPATRSLVVAVRLSPANAANRPPIM